MKIKLGFLITREIEFNLNEEELKQFSALHGDISTTEIFDRIIAGIKEDPKRYLFRELVEGELETITVTSQIEI